MPARFRRPPHEHRGTEDEDQESDAARAATDRAESDPPDEVSGKTEHAEWDDLQRDRVDPEDAKRERGQESLETAAIRLAPEERGQLPVPDVPRHQSDDRFIGIDVADACAQNEEAKGKGRADNESREQDAPRDSKNIMRAPSKSRNGEGAHRFGD